jgi:hypothetical protein
MRVCYATAKQALACLPARRLHLLYEFIYLYDGRQSVSSSIFVVVFFTTPLRSNVKRQNNRSKYGIDNNLL